MALEEFAVEGLCLDGGMKFRLRMGSVGLQHRIVRAPCSREQSGEPLSSIGV